MFQQFLIVDALNNGLIFNEKTWIAYVKHGEAPEGKNREKKGKNLIL